MIGTMALLLSACHPADIRPNEASADAIQRGRDAAERLGCGACHAVPGVAWPRGTAGPSLDGFGRRALVAGTLPNRAATLAEFVRDAPSLVPGGAMPAIPMQESEARDIAAWLQSLR